MNTKVSINEQIRLILIENSEVLFGTKIDENLIQFQKTRKEVEGDVTLVIFPFVKALKCSPIEAGTKIGDFLKEKLNLIASFEDLFTLKKGDLMSLPRFAEKSVDNLLASIEKARLISLPKFLVGLSISQVGEETAIDLAKHYGTLEKLREADFEELQNLDGIGPIVARALVDYFANQNNKRLLKNLLLQVKISNFRYSESLARSGKLTGQSFVITGTLSKMSRDEAKDKIRALGGSVSESVSSKTTYLVFGENAGAKQAKAQKLGIKVLAEKEFLGLIS